MATANEHTRTLAKALIASYPQEDRQNLLLWAQAVVAVQKTDWSSYKKLRQIGRVTQEMGVSKEFITHFAKELKRVGWDERSRPMRGLIGGFGVGLGASLSGPMAGLAAFGGAVAIPVVLLSGMAGATLVVAIDELKGKSS